MEEVVTSAPLEDVLAAAPPKADKAVAPLWSVGGSYGMDGGYCGCSGCSGFGDGYDMVRGYGSGYSSDYDSGYGRSRFDGSYGGMGSMEGSYSGVDRCVQRGGGLA